MSPHWSDAPDPLVVGPVVLGLLYCARDYLAIRRVRLDARKEDGCLDRVLLEHREAQLEGLKHISGLIAEGADTFLMAEYRYLGAFVASFALIVGLVNNASTAVAFVVGCLTSILAGYVGIKVATWTNSRATHECWRSINEGYVVALRGGCIASFSLVCLGVCNLFVLILIFRAAGLEGNEMWESVAGFSLGASSVALFGRVGGGIYTKAADIGADLSGKLDFGLSEDDYRNPACIADNVGDNVGGVVGIGADLFSSLAGATCAAFVIAGHSGSQECSNGLDVGTQGIANDWRAMMFPLVISSTSIVTNLAAALLVENLYRVREVSDVERAVKRLVMFATLAETPLVYFLARWALPPKFMLDCNFVDVTPMDCTIVIWLGLWAGLVIGSVTEYYTSHKCRPVQEIAAAQEVSASSGIIFGLAVGYKSCAIPAFCIAILVLVAQSLVGPYGIALGALGMLTVMPVALAVDAYDSIADNASGIAEMSGLSNDVRQITDVLGGAGAIGNGFAIGSAALGSMSLVHAFWLRVGVPTQASTSSVETVDRWYFTGLLLGSALPYVFSAVTMRAVGNAATDMVEECRRQFPGIINARERPDYSRCIKIATEASLKEMRTVALLVIGAPIVSGLLFGKKGTAGVLQGALISGVQMAISMINTGGAWDNAKRLVVDRGMKESEQFKNAVIGDIVGDPLKDVSGPSLNVLMSLSAITSLVFGNVINDWSCPDGGPLWMPALQALRH